MVAQLDELFLGLALRASRNFQLVDQPPHQLFVAVEVSTISFVVEKALEIVLAQFLRKAHHWVIVRVAGLMLDGLDDVENGVCLFLLPGDGSEVTIGLGTQLRLEVFVRGERQVEPQAPRLSVGSWQRAAIELADDLLDGFRIVFLEADQLFATLLEHEM